MLPATVAAALRPHLERVARLHRSDLGAGLGRVPLPHALARKLPGAATDWRWQWVFPAPRLSTDPRTGETGRHHLHPERIQRALARAAAGRHREARHLPHPAPQLRHPPPGSRLRHPHRPGAPRPPPGDDHDDLHPRPQPRRPRRPQPPRHPVTRPRIIRPISPPFPPRALTASSPQLKQPIARASAEANVPHSISPNVTPNVHAACRDES